MRLFDDNVVYQILAGALAALVLRPQMAFPLRMLPAIDGGTTAATIR
jgi:hypothetical protein